MANQRPLSAEYMKGRYNLTVTGFYNVVDNRITTAWSEALKVIRPREVMLYSVGRKTPYDTLYKVEGDELQVIADRVEAEGIKTQVTK